MALTVAQLVARLTADTSGFYRGMAVANASMIRSGGIISRVAAGAGLAVTALGVVSLRSAGNFQQSMNILGAVSEATTAQMNAMRKEAIALGADIKLPNVSAKDAADAMQSLARAGLSVKDTMAATRGVLQFGISANIGFADSANIVARSLTAFHLQGGQAVRVADLFTAAANKSTAEATDMALGFQMASARFASTHQSIQDLTTAITLMANAGIVGSDAGTSLKTMMNRLVAPTNKAKDLMAEMGFNVYTSSGHMKKLPQIIANLNQSLKGMSEAQRNAALYTLFGSDAIRAATVLTDAGAKGFLHMREEVTKGGEAQAFAEARTKGFNGALQAFGSQVETFAIQLGTRMLPSAESAVRGMSDFVASLDANAIADFAAGILGVVGSIGHLAFGTRAGQSAVLGLTAAFLTFKTAVMAATVANRAYMLVLDLMTTTFSRLTVIGAAAAAIIGLGIALHHLLSATQETSAATQHLIDVMQRWAGVANGARDATNELANAKLGVRRATLDVEQAERNYATTVANSGKNSLAARGATLMLDEAKQRLKEAIQRVKTATLEEDNAQKKLKNTHDEVVNSVEKLRQKYAEQWREGEKLIKTGTGLQVGMKIQSDAAKGLQHDLLVLADKADRNAKANEKAHPQIAAASAKIRDQALATAALSKKLGEVPAAVSKMGIAAAAAARIVGSSIANGIIAGAAGLGARLAGSLVAQIAGAIAAAQASIAAGSPSKVTEKKIGLPLAQGIIVGYLNGTADLPAKVSDRIRKALDKAKETIDSYRSKLRDAFGRLASDALSAFDAITQQTMTPTEALLAGENESRAQAELQRTLERAKQQYEKTMQDADATDQDRLDAWQAVQDAEWEIRRVGLERQAAEERKQYDASREMQKRSLDDQLAVLEEKLAKHPEQYRKIQAQIIALLQSYGVTYDSVGQALGTAYAAGMWKAFPQIRKVAQAIADEVARILSQPFARGRGKGGGKGKATGGTGGGNQGAPSFVQVGGKASPAVAAGGGGKGGDTFLSVNMFGTVLGDDREKLAQELLEPLRNELTVIDRRNSY